MTNPPVHRRKSRMEERNLAPQTSLFSVHWTRSPGQGGGASFRYTRELHSSTPNPQRFLETVKRPVAQAVTFLPSKKYPAFSTASFGQKLSPPQLTPGGQQMATSSAQMLHCGLVELVVVEFRPGNEDEFSMGKTSLLVLKLAIGGKVVGKHFSDAITTMVPYELFPNVGGKEIGGLEEDNAVELLLAVGGIAYSD